MTVPMSAIEHSDPLNAQILAVSEDQIKGFVREPFIAIAEKSGVPLDTVLDRIRTMLQAGTIRRVRQTLMSTQLAEGALVAWVVPEEKLNAAFDFMFKQDPFSGHVVVRSTDQQTAGSQYRLWTTLKVPVGRSMAEHCAVLMRQPLSVLGQIGKQREQHEAAHEIQRIIKRQRPQSAVARIGALNTAETVYAGRADIFGLPV